MNGEASYRTYISPNEQAYLSDRRILERAAGRDYVSPPQLAGTRRRENVIRLQCRDLANAGLLQERAHEVYSITKNGMDILPGPPEQMAHEGLFDMQTFSGFSPPSTNWRISDFSILDPPTIKQINF
ncbi:MAG: hypothetical protein ACI8UR_002413, partial [Natronomonas sp.]